jgi:hypothetical protein
MSQKNRILSNTTAKISKPSEFSYFSRPALSYLPERLQQQQSQPTTHRKLDVGAGGAATSGYEEPQHASAQPHTGPTLSLRPSLG